MGRTIWETVAANKIQKGDVIQWGTDTADRVRVDDVRERPGTDVLPYIALHVVGPSDRWERNAGLSTGRLYCQGNPVRRLLPAHAARVSDANLRTVK